MVSHYSRFKLPMQPSETMEDVDLVIILVQEKMISQIPSPDNFQTTDALEIYRREFTIELDAFGVQDLRTDKSIINHGHQVLAARPFHSMMVLAMVIT